MSSARIDESRKAAIAIKTGRTALGLNQTEMAKLVSVSRVTLARIETFEMPIKLETYFCAIRELKKLGVEIDATSGEDVVIKVTPEGQQRVIYGLGDMRMRKVDKK